MNLRKLTDKVFSNKIAKNIALLTSGTAIAQIVAIVSSPIITRLYNPEQYGVLTAYTAMLNIFSVVSTLEYQKAIPIAQDDSESIDLVVLSIMVLLLFTSLLSITLFEFGEYLLNLLNNQVLIVYMFLIPLGVLLSGLYTIMLHWAFRKQSYKKITRTKIYQGFTSSFMKIFFGLIQIGPIGLIFSFIVGQSAGLSTLSSDFLRDNLKGYRFSKHGIIRVAKRYLRFPVYTATSNYLYMLGFQIPVIAITLLFGQATIGYFGLANSIVNLPIGLIGMSVADVFYSEASRIGKNNPKELMRLSMSLVKKMTIIGLAPLLFIVILGPWVFSVVFGSAWYISGEYARLLSVFTYFHFIILPVGRILEIIEKQNISLIITGSRLVLVIITFGLSSLLNLSSYQTIGLYSIIISITYLLLLMTVRHVLKNEIILCSNIDERS